MKKIISISVDEELHKKAQQFNLNISGVTEAALKQKLNIKEIELINQCQFCNKVFTDETGQFPAKASIENLNGLCWLWPDEKWICYSCLTQKIKKAGSL